MAQASAPQPSFGIDIGVLERTAEDISSAASAAGSDIGEEIRKMVEAERSRSRSASQSSQSQSHGQQENIVLSPTTRPRRISSIRSRATSNSYANSVSDARLGITSPVESVRSAGSWSQSMHRARLAMDSSMHSAGAFEPTHEPLQEGRPLDSPLAPTASMRSAASHYSGFSQDNTPSRRVSQSSLTFSYTQGNAMSRQASQSSFAQRYDHMAGQIEEQLQTIPHTPEAEQEDQFQQQYEPQYNQQERGRHDPQHSRDVADTPDRPHSVDTYQEAELAFQDFDGVHFNSATEELVAVDENGNEVRRVSARTSSGSLLDAAQLQQIPHPRMKSPSNSYGPRGPPPPEAGMVYYPAPVPRMLNLPKRLSQLPAASAQAAKRRTQLLDEMNRSPKEEVHAPHIPKMSFDETDGTTEVITRDRPSSQPEPPTEKLERNSQILLDQRRSVANMKNVPPQLRASVFFEHQPISQPSYAPNVQVKHESAVATLDSILAASATAPVSAFMDHPFAGDVRRSVYAMEKPAHRRKDTSAAPLSTDLPIKESDKDLKKKRSSSFGNFFRRSSGDLLAESEIRRPPSRGSQMLDDVEEDGRKLQKRKSQMSLADPLERQKALHDLEGRTDGLVSQAANNSAIDDENSHILSPGLQNSTGKTYTEGEQIEEDFREQEAMSDVDQTDPIFAQPSTLLAELQVRKAQLKNRTRTAAVAYPNGMHSTLLQLDAVEQINKQKRQKQRIALAWEDPHQAALDDTVNENDDVPLGVLYPSKDGLINRKTGDARDWSRPMGLMEQREMEDTEPLSRRAERLNPGRVHRRPQQQRRQTSQMHLAGAAPPPEEAAVSEDDPLRDGETLGQRMTRIRDKEALDVAISDVVAKPGSRPISTFSTDVLSQFGGLNNVKDSPSPDGEEEPEEETLGQRRARLQRERSVSGEVTGSDPQARPALRTTNSMANLLSANPVRAPAAARAWEGQGGQGLLQASAANQARQKEELRNTNLRSNYALPYSGHAPPFVDRSSRRQSGLLAEVRARPANGQFVPTAGVSFASPTAAAAMGYGGQMMMMGMPQQQMNLPAYYALQGGGQHMMAPATYAPTMGMGGYGMPQQQMMYGAPQQSYGMGGMGMNMGMGELPLAPNQRAAIDRWRMGIGGTPLAPRN